MLSKPKNPEKGNYLILNLRLTYIYVKTRSISIKTPCTTTLHLYCSLRHNHCSVICPINFTSIVELKFTRQHELLQQYFSHMQHMSMNFKIVMRTPPSINNSLITSKHQLILILKPKILANQMTFYFLDYARDVAHHSSR
jgi:hypothetical protein